MEYTVELEKEEIKGNKEKKVIKSPQPTKLNN